MYSKLKMSAEKNPFSIHENKLKQHHTIGQ